MKEADQVFRAEDVHDACHVSNFDDAWSGALHDELAPRILGTVEHCKDGGKERGMIFNQQGAGDVCCGNIVAVLRGHVNVSSANKVSWMFFLGGGVICTMHSSASAKRSAARLTFLCKVALMMVVVDLPSFRLRRMCAGQSAVQLMKTLVSVEPAPTTIRPDLPVQRMVSGPFTTDFGGILL